MKVLQQLSEAVGVSGAETEVRSAILKLIEPHVDDIQTDVMGNIIALKKGTKKNGFKVMVDAHMDEVGFMVSGHENNGTLKVESIGGLDNRILLGKRVLVGEKCIPGVIGMKPIHLLSATERDKVVELKSMRVDIGVTSKSAAEGKAPLGTRIAFDSEFMQTRTHARGKAFDDRAGCSVLVHLLEADPYPFDLYASFTVQEEVGLRGARVAAHRIEPNCAFALEGTIADDLPKEDDVSPTTQLGKGPAISVMDRSTIFSHKLNNLLAATGDELGIPYQFKQPGVGGTNAGSISLTGVGVPVASVAVPCRYIHSPAAMLYKRDYQNAAKLVEAALRRLTPETIKQ